MKSLASLFYEICKTSETHNKGIFFAVRLNGSAIVFRSIWGPWHASWKSAFEEPLFLQCYNQQPSVFEDNERLADFSRQQPLHTECSAKIVEW